MLELADYIELLSELPEEPPVVLETNDQKAVFRSISEGYRGIALWLQLLLLGKKLPAIALSKYALYQPHAEYLSAFFRLCTGVYPRSELLQLNFDSPAKLWYICELGRSKRQVERAGLLGYVPYFLGKTEWYEDAANFREKCLDLELPVEDAFCQSQREDLSCLLPRALVEIEALRIARQDNDFYKDYYQPYQRSDKRFFSKVRRCKELQFVYLDKEGRTFVTGKQRRLPKGL